MNATVTNVDKGEYLRLKFQMKNGFDQAIKAIEAIRDDKLYKVEYDTFEDFCQKECGHTRQHINHLIKAANVIEPLESNLSNFPIKPDAAIELGTIEDSDERLLVYHSLKEIAGQKTITRPMVLAAKTVTDDFKLTGGVNVGNGVNTPLTAAITLRIAENRDRQNDHIRLKLGGTEEKLLPVIHDTLQHALEQLAEYAGSHDVTQEVTVIVYRGSIAKGSSS